MEGTDNFNTNFKTSLHIISLWTSCTERPVGSEPGAVA